MKERLPAAPDHVLHEGEAHIWRVRIDDPSQPADALLACLSTEERARADRHRSAAARRRFALSRGLLRNVLARYAGAAAAELTLASSTRGKPALADAPGLHFSLSHSGDLTLIAIARLPIGVDVEQVRRPRRLSRVAHRMLHRQTAALLDAMPPELRVLAFLDAWTQREAHVKAVGGGLFHTPDALPFNPALPADGALHTVRDRIDREEWTLARLPARDSTRASLVVRGPLRQLRLIESMPDGE